MSIIETNLHLFENLITCGYNFSFWSFDAGLNILHTNYPNAELLTETINLKNYPEKYRASGSGQAPPVILTNELGLMWIVAKECSIDGAIKRLHAIGPVYLLDVSSSDMERFLSFHHVQKQKREKLREILKELPVITLNRFQEYGLMLHYCVSAEKLNFSDFIFVSNPVYKQENGEPDEPTDYHGTWAMEQRLMRLVEEGNLSHKELTSKLIGAARLGMLGNGDPLRHVKNHGVVFTALCTRSAIRGGLPPEVAYTVSDRYITATEACHKISDVMDTMWAMQRDFVHQVHQCRIESGQSPTIKVCQNYLQIHLSEKVSIRDLAARMGYSEPHLCKIFKKETGMTISEYLMFLRVETAKDLLRDEKKSVQQICMELGFCSQSYFGMKFKEYTGVTPSAYRKNVKGS